MNKISKRKRRLRKFLIWLFVVSLVYLVGPRESVGEIEATRPVELPEDLDGYLFENESAFGDELVESTKKKIFWNSEASKKKTAISVVYLHGFSGSHMTLEPVMNRVAEELDANLFCSRYAGHGLKDSDGYGEALGDATIQEWVDDTREALAIGRRLGKKVVVLANSTAAPIVSYLASIGEAPDALVMLSPNFRPKSGLCELILGPWGRQIVWLTHWGRRENEPENIMGELHREYATTEYPSRALLVMMKAVELGRTAELERITAPSLCLYSETDQVVYPAATEECFARFGGEVKILEALPTEHVEEHVLAGSLMAPTKTEAVTRRIVTFVNEQLAPVGP